MKNKKFLAITAVLTAAVLAGGSLAIFAAETAVPEVEVVEIESELTALIEEETEAEPAAPDVEVVEITAEPTAPAAEEIEAEPTVPAAEETEAEPAVSEAEADDTDYSYHVGQQSSTARNDTYAALPEGGTKEDAEEFYETYEVGGGAWADGAYDESLKSGYGYAEGQQRAAQYAQDGDDDEEYKAGYSYSVGRQNYMDNYPNYRK